MAAGPGPSRDDDVSPRSPAPEPEAEPAEEPGQEIGGQGVPASADPGARWWMYSPDLEGPQLPSTLDTRVGGREEAYVTVSADEAAGSARNAFWAFTAGFFLHGTGHYLSGDTTTAVTLLGVEAAGVGMWGSAMLADSLTGHSRVLAPYTRALATVGMGAFLGSWFVDLVSAFTGKAGTARYTPPPPDPITGLLYYTLWSDPVQGHLNLFTGGLTVPMGRVVGGLDRVQVSARAGWDPFSDTSGPLHWGTTATVRLLGEGGELASRVGLELDWTHENRWDHGYGVSTASAALAASYNLGSVLPRFRHLVFLARWGYGLEATAYEDHGSMSLAGDRRWITIGELGMILPLMRRGRMDLRWRILNERLFAGARPGRGPYGLGFAFQIATQMDLLLSLNGGTGFDGWIGVTYRYY